MTTIGVGLGGTPAGAAGGGSPGTEWRQRPPTRQAVNWSKEEYASPGVPPPQHHGRHVQPIADVPALRERLISVRAKPPASFYTFEGTPIPADHWTTLPISPGLIKAVKEGDLERGEDPVWDQEPHAQQKPQHQAPSQSHRRQRHDNPTPVAE